MLIVLDPILCKAFYVHNKVESMIVVAWSLIIQITKKSNNVYFSSSKYSPPTFKHCRRGRGGVGDRIPSFIACCHFMQ